MSEYIELRTRSAFSFLEGASPPEELVARAAALGYPALALTDKNLCGAPRFHKAARAAGLRPLVGAEVRVAGVELVLLCETAVGYAHLCRLLTLGVGRPAGLTWDELGQHAAGLVVLSGGAGGLLAAALVRGDGEASADALAQLLEVLDPQQLYLELQIVCFRQARVNGSEDGAIGASTAAC